MDITPLSGCLCLSHRGDRILCSDPLLVSSLDEVLCHGVNDGDYKVDYHEEEDPAKHPLQQTGLLEEGRKDGKNAHAYMYITEARNQDHS